MALFETISYYMSMVMTTLFLLVGIVVALLIYFLKFKKVTATVERVDYSSFRRMDSLEYVKFDNIYSESGDIDNSPAMICVQGNTYVAGLSVYGYSFATASAEEKERTMMGAVTFFNSVDGPVQFTQTAQAIDLTPNIQTHQDILERLVIEGASLEVEYEETNRMAEDYVDTDEYYIYKKRLAQLRKQIDAKKHSVEETKALLAYMEALSVKGGAGTQKVHHFMFEWTYNPDETIGELSEEEIRLNAFEQLDTLGKKYAAAFSRCGYTAKRLSAPELTLQMYKRMHPLTSDDISMEDILNSSYTALFVTSDSLYELEKERLGEEAFERKMEEYQRAREELLYQQALEAEKQQQEMFNEAHARAVAEVG